MMDANEYIYIYIGKAVSDHFVQNVFNLPTFAALPVDSVSIDLTLPIDSSSSRIFSIRCRHWRILYPRKFRISSPI